MHISVLADVHLANHVRCGGPLVGGMNRRARHILDVLRTAVDGAPTGRLFVLGDLFDTAKPEPVLLAEVQEIFSSRRDLEICLLVGNHDASSTGVNHNALAPLKPVARVVETVTCIVGDPDVLLIPYHCNVLAEIEQRLGQTKRHVLVFAHCGVKDLLTPFFLQDDKKAVDVAALRDLQIKFPHFVGFAAGDWHTRATWYRDDGCCDILQVGALVPTGWDNPGRCGFGTRAVWSRSGWRITELSGPRFVDSFEDAELAPVPYLRLRAQASEVEAIRARCGAMARLEDYVIEVVKTEPESVAVRSLASALTIREALRVYVQKMPANVRKDMVLAKVESYLGGA